MIFRLSSNNSNIQSVTLAEIAALVRHNSFDSNTVYFFVRHNSRGSNTYICLSITTTVIAILFFVRHIVTFAHIIQLGSIGV